MRNFLLAKEYPAIYELLRTELTPLVAYHLKPLRALDELILCLMTRYLRPSITSVASSSYRLLEQYNQNMAQEWLRQRHNLAEEGLSFFKKLFRCEIGTEYSLDEATSPLLLGQRDIPLTVQSIQQELCLLRDLAHPSKDYWKILNNEIKNYLHRLKASGQPNLAYAAIFTLLGDADYISEYALAFLEKNRSNLFLFLQHDFFQKNRQNVSLQFYVLQRLQEYLVANPEWSPEIEKVITYLMEPKDRAVLCQILIQHAEWQTEIQELVESMGSEAQIKVYRLQWLKQALGNPNFLQRKPQLLPLDKDLESLKKYYGIENMPQVVEFIRDCLLNPQPTSVEAIHLLDGYLRDDFFKEHAQFNLQELWEKYRLRAGAAPKRSGQSQRNYRRIRQRQICSGCCSSYRISP